MPATLSIRPLAPEDRAALRSLQEHPGTGYVTSVGRHSLGGYACRVEYGPNRESGNIILDGPDALQRSVCRRIFDKLAHGIPLSGTRKLTDHELSLCRRVDHLYELARPWARNAALLASSAIAHPEAVDPAIAGPAQQAAQNEARAMTDLERAIACARDPAGELRNALALAWDAAQWDNAVAILHEPAVQRLFWRDATAVRQMASYCPDAHRLLVTLPGPGSAAEARREALLRDYPDIVTTALCRDIEKRAHIGDAWELLRPILTPDPHCLVTGYLLKPPLDRTQYADRILAALFGRLSHFHDAGFVTGLGRGLHPKLYTRHLAKALQDDSLRARIVASLHEEAEYGFLLATEPNSKVADMPLATASQDRMPLAPFASMQGAHWEPKDAAINRFSLSVFSFLTGQVYAAPYHQAKTILSSDEVCRAASDLVWRNPVITAFLKPIADKYKGSAYHVIAPLMKCHENAALVGILQDSNPLLLRK